MNPIVGIGELLWDVFPDGRMVAGGAPFNFAFHCRQLGHDAVIVSRVGDDDLGRELRAEVRRLGLSDEFIQTDPDHPTGTVQVTVDANGQPSYEIVEDVAWDYIVWNDQLEQLATRARAVCFGTLAQREPESAAAIRSMISGAKNGLVIFDVNLRIASCEMANLVWDCARMCDWFKLSVEDLWLVHAQFSTDGPDKPPSHPIREFFDVGLDQAKLGILTHGPKGVDVVDWQRIYHERGVEADVVDTVGAGDSFMAAFLCCHLEGRPLKQTMRFALHYAARVCESAGATPLIDRDEIEIRLLDDPWMRSR
jgi:fructokinase